MKNSCLFSGVNRWFGLLLSVLFSVVIFSCSEEEESITKENEGARKAGVRMTHDEYLEYMKLPQFVSVEWRRQTYPEEEPVLEVTVQQSNEGYDMVEIGVSDNFTPKPAEYSYFSITGDYLQPGMTKKFNIPLSQLKSYIAVRASCSDNMMYPLDPPTTNWNPYAVCIGYDLNSGQGIYEKSSSLYGSIAVYYPPKEQLLRKMSYRLFINDSEVANGEYNPFQTESAMRYIAFTHFNEEEIKITGEVQYIEPKGIPIKFDVATIYGQSSIIMASAYLPIPDEQELK